MACFQDAHDDHTREQVVLKSLFGKRETKFPCFITIFFWDAHVIEPVFILSHLQFVPFIRKHGEIRHRPFLKIRHAFNNIPLPDQTTSFFTFTINHAKHDQCVHVTYKSAYFSIIKLCAFQLMARNQVHILLPSIRTTKINSSMKFPHGSRTIMIMCALSALFFFFVTDYAENNKTHDDDNSTTQNAPNPLFPFYLQLPFLSSSLIFESCHATRHSQPPPPHHME